MSEFPEYEWLPWKFNTVPKGFWDDRANIDKYMSWLSKELNIKTIEDWYNVTQKVRESS